MQQSIAQTLRGFSLTPLLHRVEVYRRLWMFPRHFISQFQDREAELARSAFKSFLDIAIERDEEYFLLIADSLENKFKLPAFMSFKSDQWMNSVRYLAYGDSSWDKKVSPEEHQLAYDAAWSDVRADLEGLFLSLSDVR